MMPSVIIVWNLDLIASSNDMPILSRQIWDHGLSKLQVLFWIVTIILLFDYVCCTSISRWTEHEEIGLKALELLPGKRECCYRFLGLYALGHGRLFTRNERDSFCLQSLISNIFLKFHSGAFTMTTWLLAIVASLFPWEAAWMWTHVLQNNLKPGRKWILWALLALTRLKICMEDLKALR